MTSLCQGRKKGEASGVQSGAGFWEMLEPGGGGPSRGRAPSLVPPERPSASIYCEALPVTVLGNALSPTSVAPFQ